MTDAQAVALIAAVIRGTDHVAREVASHANRLGSERWPEMTVADAVEYATDLLTLARAHVEPPAP